MEYTIPRMRTIEEAAKETGLSKFCIRRWCVENTQLARKTGSKYLVNVDKLIEFLNGEV